MIAIGAPEIFWATLALICLGCLVIGYLAGRAHQAKRLRELVIGLEADFVAQLRVMQERHEQELQSLREHPPAGEEATR